MAGPPNCKAPPQPDLLSPAHIHILPFPPIPPTPLLSPIHHPSLYNPPRSLSTLPFPTYYSTRLPNPYQIMALD